MDVSSGGMIGECSKTGKSSETDAFNPTRPTSKDAKLKSFCAPREEGKLREVLECMHDVLHPCCPGLWAS